VCAAAVAAAAASVVVVVVVVGIEEYFPNDSETNEIKWCTLLFLVALNIFSILFDV
jgi:hypothetical protein